VFPVCSPEMAADLKEPADILALPAIIAGRAMFTWEVWMREAGLSGATLPTRHVFTDASLCLDAALAGKGVLLAWQTLSA
ncbi:LysR family transcriptional regulator, partial [Rhizobium leguminosarum]